MTAIKRLLATLSVFAFGGLVQGLPAEAKVTTAEIENACDNALAANSIEALESFLHKYPAAKYRSDTPCYALALGALEQFGANQNADPIPRNNDDNRYGG